MLNFNAIVFTPQSFGFFDFPIITD